MTTLFDWVINLELHEIILWILVLLLLLWEFVVRRKARKTLESGINKLKTEFMRLGFTTELSKKEIGELIRRFDTTEKRFDTTEKRFDATEREVDIIKKETREMTQMEKHMRAAETKLEIRNEHLFILKLLESTEEKRIIADFIPAYYLDVFKDKDRFRYKEIIGQLLDHELINFFSIGGKSYVVITKKGIDFLQAIEKIE